MAKKKKKSSVGIPPTFVDNIVNSFNRQVRSPGTSDAPRGANVSTHDPHVSDRTQAVLRPAPHPGEDLTSLQDLTQDLGTSLFASAVPPASRPNDHETSGASPSVMTVGTDSTSGSPRHDHDPRSPNRGPDMSPRNASDAPAITKKPDDDNAPVASDEASSADSHGRQVPNKSPSVSLESMKQPEGYSKVLAKDKLAAPASTGSASRDAHILGNQNKSTKQSPGNDTSTKEPGESLQESFEERVSSLGAQFSRETGLDPCELLTKALEDFQKDKDQVDSDLDNKKYLQDDQQTLESPGWDGAQYLKYTIRSNPPDSPYQDIEVFCEEGKSSKLNKLKHPYFHPITMTNMPYPFLWLNPGVLSRHSSVKAEGDRYFVDYGGVGYSEETFGSGFDCNPDTPCQRFIYEDENGEWRYFRSQYFGYNQFIQKQREYHGSDPEGALFAEEFESTGFADPRFNNELAASIVARELHILDQRDLELSRISKKGSQDSDQSKSMFSLAAQMNPDLSPNAPKSRSNDQGNDSHGHSGSHQNDQGKASPDHFQSRNDDQDEAKKPDYNVRFAENEHQAATQYQHDLNRVDDYGNENFGGGNAIRQRQSYGRNHIHQFPDEDHGNTPVPGIHQESHTGTSTRYPVFPTNTVRTRTPYVVNGTTHYPSAHETSLDFVAAGQNSRPTPQTASGGSGGHYPGDNGPPDRGNNGGRPHGWNNHSGASSGPPFRRTPGSGTPGRGPHGSNRGTTPSSGGNGGYGPPGRTPGGFRPSRSQSGSANNGGGPPPPYTGGHGGGPPPPPPHPGGTGGHGGRPPPPPPPPGGGYFPYPGGTPGGGPPPPPPPPGGGYFPYPGGTPGGGPPPPPPPPGGGYYPPPYQGPSRMDAFLKGVKRNKDDFPTLKEEKQWDPYRRSFVATALTQDMADVLNPNFVPHNDRDSVGVFRHKQLYMYSVLDKSLKTTYGKHLVKKYEKTYDAQAIWRDLTQHASTSATAIIETEKILRKVTTIKLNKDTWRGTNEGFVLHFDEELDLYNNLVENPSSILNDSLKMTLLKTAVSEVPELQRIKDQADMEQVFSHGQHSLDYNEYKSLLLSACATLDERRGYHRSSRGSTSSSRRAYHIEQDAYAGDDHGFIDESQDDRDYFEDRLQYDINVANQGKNRRRPFRPSVNKETWNSLPDEEKKKWDAMSQDAKALILGYSKKLAEKRGVSANVTELEEGQIGSHSEGEEDHATQESDDHDETSTYLINNITKGNAHPGDIKRVFGQKGGTSKEKQEKNASRTASYIERISYQANIHQTRIINNEWQDAEREEFSMLLDNGHFVQVSDDDRSVDSDDEQMPPLMPRLDYDSSSSEGSLDEEDDLESVGEVDDDDVQDTFVPDTSKVTYNVMNRTVKSRGALVDRGANGGIAGDDVRIVEKTDRKVDLSGIDSHEVRDLPIVTAGAVVQTQRGPVIAIMHQYAYMGEHKTIHSSAQIEHYKNKVDDRSAKVGGKHCITTLEGYMIPMRFRNGLGYIAMRPFTDYEWDSLPHVILTGEPDWDPSVMDFEIDEEWYESSPDDPNNYFGTSNYDQFGRPKPDLYESNLMQYAVDDIGDELDLPRDPGPPNLEVNDKEFKRSKVDLKSLLRFFIGASTVILTHTLAATTQYGRTAAGNMTIRNTYKSPNPALNVQRRAEPVATDMAYSDTPAVDDGSTKAQIFVGRKSLFADAYGCNTDKQFVGLLQDNIRKRGAMDMLISDSAQAEVSEKVKEVLRTYCIDDWQSEAEQQQQNYAERRWNTIKTNTQNLMNGTGAPANTWLLALQYTVYVMNRTAVESLGWRTPYEKLKGVTPDISAITKFAFYEPVYFKAGEKQEKQFPSHSNERLAYVVGISENVGHAMTYKILTADTQKVIERSQLRSALREEYANKRAQQAALSGTDDVTEVEQFFFRSAWDKEEHQGTPLPTYDPRDLVGRTYISSPDDDDDGAQHRVDIIDVIEQNKSVFANQPDVIRFRCRIGDKEFDELLTYNQMLQHVERDTQEEDLWRFKDILDHRYKPAVPGTKKKKGKKATKGISAHWEVLVHWENGDKDWRPLSHIAETDFASCAVYAKKNNLLEEPGWKRFKHLAKKTKTLFRQLHQAKLKSFKNRPIYQYGYRVPRNHAEAMEIDARNGNKKWQESEELELSQLDEYDTFRVQERGATIPDGYKKIRVHMVYAVKHDGRHKSRLVAGGHLTEIPIDSVYSGVVSLRGLRIVAFLAELNHLQLWSTDIGNAYLESLTKEKVCFIAGAEFGPLAGRLLLIHKALYGLRSSGLRWHERLSDVLQGMGFFPSKADEDIWMRDKGDHYEYIAVYVDDLAIASKDPQPIIDELKNKHHFKLKGTGPITFHLGCDYFRDKDNVLCTAPRKYIDKLIDNYFHMFGTKPKQNVTSPLEKGDHPEIDTSELLDIDGIKKYQSLIGALQWAISIGRLDITTAVMTMSGFRTAPRQGHLDRVKRIVGYLAKMKFATIRIRTDEPDYSDLPDPDYDWARSVYGNVTELIPPDAPKPLGKRVVQTTYVDANLYHDLLTGRSVTGVLHLLNQTPIDWFSRKQATVETATYGSEFSASRTAIQQIIDLRLTLRYLGVPVHDRTYMFGDNESVVKSSSMPHSRLHKRHTALSYHLTREAIAAGLVRYYHIPGDINPADILSKHWGYQQVWPTMRPLLFYEGDTTALLCDKETVAKPPPDSSKPAESTLGSSKGG